jgi:hypothetical protein
MKTNPIDAQLALITEEELAAFRGCKVHTLRNERGAGGGPAYVKIGRTVKYLMADVAAYIDACKVTPRRGRS